MGHGRARSSRRLSQAASSGGLAWRQHVKSGVFLLVAAVSLYVLLPTLVGLGVVASLSHLNWPFAILAVACEAASLVWLVGAGPDRAGNKGQVPDRLRAACRERCRSDRAGRAHAVRVRRRPGDSGAHRLDRTAAWDHGGAAAACAAGDRRRRAGQPRPCQRAYLGIGVLLLLRAAGTAAFQRIGRWSLRAAVSSGCSTPRCAGTGTWSASRGSCWPIGTSRPNMSPRCGGILRSDRRIPPRPLGSLESS